jgi:uncharacterized protein YbaA (DUF1428 family)
VPRHLVCAGAAKAIDFYKEASGARMQPDIKPMPFDGKRLIYGGFNVLVDV